jgi:hypothetical protein
LLVGALTRAWGVGDGAHGSGCVVWAELAWKQAASSRAARSPARLAASPADGTRLPGWEALPQDEAESPGRGFTPPPSGTARPGPGRAISPPGGALPAPDGGESSPAAAQVPPIPRPRVTSPHVTRPVPRSAEGHPPHGTPARLL